MGEVGLRNQLPPFVKIAEKVFWEMAMTLIAFGSSYLCGEIRRDGGSFWECVVVVATVAWNTPRQTEHAHVSWCKARGPALVDGDSHGIYGRAFRQRKACLA